MSITNSLWDVPHSCHQVCHISTLRRINPASDIWIWSDYIELSCACERICVLLVGVRGLMKGKGWQGDEKMGLMVLEGCVIKKTHKTASLTGSRKVCCWFSPSSPYWPPVKGFTSQVIGGCLTWSGSLLLHLAHWGSCSKEEEEEGYLLYGTKT